MPYGPLSHAEATERLELPASTTIRFQHSSEIMASKQLEGAELQAATHGLHAPHCKMLFACPAGVALAPDKTMLLCFLSYIDKLNARIQVDQLDLQTPKELKSLETHLETRFIQSLHLANIFLQRRSPRSVIR